MKFTLSWLKEYLDTDATLEEILETLNKIGLEVDEVIDRSSKLVDFNCVIVEECINHPNSDHLHICQVRTNNNKEPITIICGAQNVRAGLKSILAPVKSILPNGMEIKKSKIRGIDSNGMLCSEKELGLGDDAGGIIEIDSNTAIGTNIADIFNLRDQIIDISITPNRGDCLGVYGIARDLACTGIGKLKKLEDIKFSSTFKSNKTLSVGDPNCQVFSFREIKNIKNCESPEWLKNKLKSIDVNPKNAVVDIANYVMFSLNKPLHCYDALKVNNKLRIESADGGEHFKDLFNNEYILPKGTTIVKDTDKILCLGGILGSKDSCSNMETSNVIVESAIFDPINTAKNSKLLNIQTDSKYRFERGSEYNMVDFALDYACRLIQEICGGEVSERVKCEQDDYKKSITRTIDLEINYIEKLLGLKIPEKEIMQILNSFGYKVKKTFNTLSLQIPYYKNNILCKEDVIDDIIRIYGYDNLKDKDFTDIKVFEKANNLYNKKLEEKLYQIRLQLIANGMVETVTYSFLNKNDNSYFCDSKDELDLINPIISDLSHLRESLIPNILNILKKNRNRGFENESFFEIGNIYNKCAIDSENTVLCGVRCGKYKIKDIYNETRDFDIYDIKMDLFDILNIFNIDGNKMLINNDTPTYYHPNRSGAVFMGKTLVGYFGELNPKIAQKFELKRPVIFEFFINKLPEKLIIGDKTRSAFVANDLQQVQRDFAFLIDKNTNVGSIIKDIGNLNKELIDDVFLFDIYENNIANNKKSIAIKVTLQPKIKTLTKEEIEYISKEIVDFIQKKYNAILRDSE